MTLTNHDRQSLIAQIMLYLPQVPREEVIERLRDCTNDSIADTLESLRAESQSHNRQLARAAIAQNKAKRRPKP